MGTGRPQCGEPHSRCAGLSKDGAEEGEVCARGVCRSDFFLRMTGHGDNRLAGRTRCPPDPPHLKRRNVLGSKVHPIAPDREGHIGTRVDEQASFASAAAHRIDHLASQLLQLSPGKVFLPQLDVVDAGSNCFPNFDQQLPMPLSLGAGKLSAIGDVVEEQESVNSSQLPSSSPSPNPPEAESRKPATALMGSSSPCLWVRLRNFRYNLAHTPRSVGPKVILCQTLLQNLEPFFGRIHHRE